MRGCACFALGAICFSLAAAQVAKPDEPIETARPDFTNSPQLVPVGRWQVEVGGSFYRRDDGNPKRWEFGEATVRYGASDRVELRAVLPNYTVPQEAGEAFGLDDTVLSAVVYLGNFGGTDFGILPSLIVPTGNPELRSEVTTPSLHFLANRNLAGDASFGVEVGVDAGRETNWVANAVYEAPLAERLDGFLEYAGSFVRHEEPTEYAHVGLLLRTSRVSQVDVHGGFGLDAASSPFFVGFGYSVRF